MKKSIPFIITSLLWCFSPSLSAQALQGRVLDEDGAPIFAVNVYCAEETQNGTTTDFEGYFELPDSILSCDSIVFSFLGYQSKRIAVSDFPSEELLQQVLYPSSSTLSMIEVKASPNVSEEYSLMELEPLDIYLNPAAAADPLKAITTLPYSTNDDETANPALRGSEADRSKVFLNGVPIDRPVRNAQLNGVGFFSLFNTAILDRQLVYPSNPPLNLGNASAGVVELETAVTSPLSEWKVSAGLANLGVQRTQAIQDKGLIQFYGNHQLSEPFLAFNRRAIPNLLNFASTDAGVNVALELNERSSLRLFSYGIKEKVAVHINLFANEDTARSNSDRHFHILNFKQSLKKGWFTVALGWDQRNSRFRFGNLATDEQERQWYGALNWKHYFSDSWLLQTGLTWQNNRYQSISQRPVFYYATEEADPTEMRDLNLQVSSPEWYAYLRIPLIDRLSAGLGLRTSLGQDAERRFSSYQMNVQFEMNDENKLLLAAGQYHNIAHPSYFNPDFRLLKSRQYSIEYTFDNMVNRLQLAAFHKLEKEEFAPDRNISGLEIFWQQTIGSYLQVGLANTVLDVNYQADNGTYPGENDYAYFAKLTANYNHPELLSIGLTGVFRPGRRFTPVAGSLWNAQAQAYEPMYAWPLNSSVLGAYQSISLSLSRVFDLGENELIVFANFNNLLGSQNESEVAYNEDYSLRRSVYFPGMTFYTGFVFNIKR
jgi:hypothetical protein